MDTCLTSEYKVPSCAKYDNFSSPGDSKAAVGRRQATPTKVLGQTAMSSQELPRPGQWVLVEAFNNEADEMWLAKTVALSVFGNVVDYKEHIDGQKNVC